MDGKILVGGSFIIFDGFVYNYVVCLNSDGLMDLMFNMGIGFDVVVNFIVVWLDGKILVGGFFMLYNGIVVGCMFWLNSDGMMDVFFMGIVGDNVVVVISIFFDGKIMVGGSFIIFNGVIFICVFCFLLDGVMDGFFFVGVGVNVMVCGFG